MGRSKGFVLQSAARRVRYRGLRSATVPSGTEWSAILANQRDLPFHRGPQNPLRQTLCKPKVVFKNSAPRAETLPSVMRTPPLGNPAADFKATTKTQRTAVISLRSASLFSRNGSGTREGCTFSKRLCFSFCFETHAPLGAPAATVQATTNNAAFRRD